MPHALLVEDEERFLQPLTEITHRHGFSADCARSMREARTLMEEHPADLLLLDTSLPDGKGLDLIKDAHQHRLEEVIVLSDDPDVDSLLAALRGHVRDYLTKPTDLDRVQHHLRRLAHQAEQENERIPSPSGKSVEQPPPPPARETEPGYGPMLGNSPSMLELYQMIARVAPTDATVLIVGESGTGKELVAQTLHDRSERAGQPMIPLNCGAVPANLIESELFGHEKGAFTGANALRRGCFERAGGGTLFLDEISEMPLDLQVRLLRVLETDHLQRVGGEKSVKVDVRIVAASNRNPHEAVREGKLREDLLYRLSVFPIRMTPLREREEDVELLGRHFLAELNAQHDASKQLSQEALERLKRFSWPGNVRQLRNVLHQAWIMADERIEADSLPAPLSPHEPACDGRQLHFPIGTSLAEVERHLIQTTLDHYQGDKRQTARTLGVSLKTLYNRLNHYKADVSPP